MFSQSLFARLGSLRRSQVCSRSVGTLRVAQPVPRAASSYVNLRRFSESTAPASRTEDQPPRNFRPPSGTCFVANIPYNVTAEQLKEAFSEFGKVESVRLETSASGMPRGFGFVQFSTVAEAIHFHEAHKQDPIYVLDRHLFVEHAQKSAGRHVEPSNTLMVFNFRGGDAEARTMFGHFADSILAVRFAKKDMEQAERSAFIQFHNVDIATEALEVFRKHNEGVRIVFAKQRQPSAKTDTLTSRLSQHRAD